MTQINPYVHHCIVRTGDCRGNKVLISVDAWDYEYGRDCDICGNPLVTTEQLIAHIYRELTP